MRVISYRRLREYSAKHADCRDALDDWYKAANQADWSNLIDVQTIFPKVEAVRNFTVFNIKVNKYRLIRRYLLLKAINLHKIYFYSC